MSTYDQLKTLLQVRRAAEEEAERVLAAQTDRRAETARVQILLDQAAERARQELDRGRAPARAAVVEDAHRALARQHFYGRLGEEARAAQARAARHRDGPLQEAEAALVRAQAALRLARQQREVVEKQILRAQAARRQAAARREEQALDEQAQAARDAAARAGGKNPPS